MKNDKIEVELNFSENETTDENDRWREFCKRLFKPPKFSSSWAILFSTDGKGKKELKIFRPQS